MEIADIIVLLSSIYLIIELYKRKSFAKAGNLPGPFQVLPPPSTILRFLPAKIFGLEFCKLRFGWFWSRSFQETFGEWAPPHADIFAVHTLYGPYVNIADPSLVKQVTANRIAFPKPIHLYGVLDLFGRNVVTTENEEWKVHRKIAAPGFTERNNKLVHEQTLHLCSEMFNDWDSKLCALNDGKKGVVVDVTQEFLKLALYVISGAGFGVDLDWKSGENPPEGHKLPFHKSIEIVSYNTLPRIVFPQWMFDYLPIPKFKEIDLGFKEFEKYIVELIDKAKRTLTNNEEDTADLAYSLVQADGDTLTTRELIGNIFILLFAGHETTAHTLMFGFGLLAIHQDIQKELYENIKNVIGDRLPNYEDFNELDHSLAVFEETLRLYPPVNAIPKMVGETTELGGYKLQKDVLLNIHVTGLHRNPKHWPEPSRFNPWRFLKSNSHLINWNAFVPFSDGARSCLGKRFALIEAVCIITMIVQRYRVELVNEADKSWILDAKSHITLTPLHPMPLRFVPRS